jgi:hypothetical protein
MRKLLPILSLSVFAQTWVQKQLKKYGECIKELVYYGTIAA